MARFLFVVPPLTGHTNPTVAVGSVLEARGHDVAWCGYRGFLAPLLPPTADIISINDDLPDDLVASVQERSNGLRGAKALKFLWQDFLHPLAEAMVPGVQAAVGSFRPDVMIVDQQAIAGALVARREGIRWATSATTSADLADPFALLPKLRTWVDESLVAFQVSHGVDRGSARPEAMRFSDDLVLAFTTTDLVGAAEPFPDQFAFVGPAIVGRPSTEEFPFSWLDPTVPHVLVSLGTVSASGGSRFFRVAADALADAPLQAVLVAPPNVLGEPAGSLPANVLVRERVPQLNLLPHLDAVVSHGGHNTVCETLAHGLPLVVAPIRDDQPIVADQVERSGAGVRVKYSRVRPDELRDAVVRILDEPSFRAAAKRLQESFAAAGGAAAAADHLEKLALR